MESTLLTSFLKASKIKRWMADPSNPALVRQIKSLYDNIYSPNSTDGVSTAHADELEESDDTRALLSAKKIPIDLRPLLPSPETKIRLHARFKRGGIVFSIPQTHEGNSQVYFYPNGDKLASPIPGIIRHIFTETGKRSVFVTIQRAHPIDSSMPDPFSIYRHWPARLFKSRLSESYERIQSDWVTGHFARWDYNSDQMVMLSLSRVRAHTVPQNSPTHVLSCRINFLYLIQIQKFCDLFMIFQCYL